VFRFVNIRHVYPRVVRAVLVLAVPCAAWPVHAQLTVEHARATAVRASPELDAARAAVDAAAARERQAGALPNPVLAYGREQTSRNGQTNAQGIAQIEQPLELGGQRAARREGARLRRQAAEARLAAARLQLDFEVTRAFALAVAAQQRAALAARTADTFAEAQRVSDQRLAAGDVAGYTARRLRLEAARIAALRAAAELERHTTRTALASLMGIAVSPTDTLVSTADEHAASTPAASPSLDSLLAVATRDRPELQATLLEAAALTADARLVARDRVPTPTLSAGYKGERVADPTAGSLTGFRGIVAGVSVPLPLFDRREGAMAAATADARRTRADVDALRRRIARDVSDALDALRTADAQHRALAPHLGDETHVAVRAVQAAYADGEIPLVEWLDAIRAYQDAEATLVTLRADVIVREAALRRALGAPLFPLTTSAR
jgi:outer membrane protein, heavy metal efflux system